VSHIHGPGLNIVYADREDNIAWWACARLLEWNVEVETKAILDGSLASNDPINALPFNLNPQQINPPSGVIYSANSQSMMTNGELYPGYYLPETRAERLKFLFGEQKRWDVDGMKSLLFDLHSETDKVNAKQFEVLLREADKDYTTLEQLGMKYLGNLGDYNREEISVSIYNHLLFSLIDTVFSEKVSGVDFDAFKRSHWMKRAIPELIQDPQHPVWDLEATTEVETLGDLLPELYSRCMNELVLKHSKNLDKWTWGDLHTLELEHPLAPGGGLLKSLYNIGPFPAPGSNETLMQSGFVGNTDMEYKAHFGPQMRIIVDFRDLNNSLSITPSGQSGHRWSPHYKDQVELYMNATWRPMYMSFDFESKLHQELVFHP
ncbi:MAG: penicillin acylase family protein, partial [Flavobacteriales bacterium]|nr:penicillin acylase family protein [Flavobacteriales bacterium]